MKYEEWVETLPPEDQTIFNRLTEHNMSLNFGHNGNMYVDKEWLSRSDWNDSKYHYSSIEFENFLASSGIQQANYPLFQPCCDNRWTTKPYKRVL
jgi:hypothetical protein